MSDRTRRSVPEPRFEPLYSTAFRGLPGGDVDVWPLSIGHSVLVLVVVIDVVIGVRCRPKPSIGSLVSDRTLIDGNDQWFV